MVQGVNSGGRSGDWALASGVLAQPGALALDSVQVDGAALTLGLARAARPGQAVLLTYTKPRANPLRGSFGRVFNGFARRVVTNATGGLTSVDAGEDREVASGASVTLTGSASSTLDMAARIE